MPTKCVCVFWVILTINQYYFCCTDQLCGPCNGDGISFTLGSELNIETMFGLISCGAIYLPNLLQIPCSS